MKKSAKTIALLFSAFVFGHSAYANNGNPNSENVKVNVIFNDFMSLMVAPDQTVVDLIFRTIEDYKIGVEATKVNHLTVNSALTNYSIRVESTSNHFNEVGGNDKFSQNQVSIQIEGANEVDLNKQNGHAVYTGIKGAINKQLNVTYRAKGNQLIDDKAYKYAKGNGGAVYTNNIVYTIVAN